MDNAPEVTSPTAQPPLDARGPRLVPARVTQAKFAEQLDRWRTNADAFARRGWLLLTTGDLTVEVGFLQNVALGGRQIPVMTACVRLDYWNFDLWPPSLTFLDPISRQPAPPPVRAPDRVSATEVRDALIDQHPVTRQPFLCLAGIREYHTHPQHSGDDWLLHRHLREGDLVVVCERIWRRMARNVLGMSVAIQSTAPASNAITTQLEVTLLQGDADLAQRQLAEQQAAAVAAQQAQAQWQAQAQAQGQAFPPPAGQPSGHTQADPAVAPGNPAGPKGYPGSRANHGHSIGDNLSADAHSQALGRADAPRDKSR